jgi:hypothetical protein
VRLFGFVNLLTGRCDIIFPWKSVSLKMIVWPTLTPALSRQFIVIKHTIDSSWREREKVFFVFFPEGPREKIRAVKTTDFCSLATQAQESQMPKQRKFKQIQL